MKCPICNAMLREEDLICPQCGAMIDKGKRIDQPKTEDIMDFDVFEEEEAEEERVESLRIVDGFYKSNKKREQVQKILDQACDELRRNGVILVSSKPAPGFEEIKAEWLEKAEISEEKIVAGKDAEAVETEEIDTSGADNLISNPEDEQDIEDAQYDDTKYDDVKYDDAFDAEIAAIMGEIESAVGAGKTGKKINLFHLALLILLIISLAFLLIITIGRDTAIGRKAIQLFYASAIWDRAGVILAEGDLLRII